MARNKTPLELKAEKRIYIPVYIHNFMKLQSKPIVDQIIERFNDVDATVYDQRLNTDATTNQLDINFDIES
jgi:hypothetical protein